MINFENADFMKLKKTENKKFSKDIEPMLIDGEEMVESFKSVRDGVVFTNKRIFTINVQGVTGKKAAFTCLPYSKIQIFSVETAGFSDMETMLTLWFSGLGKMTFEFTGSTNVAAICRIISQYSLD